MKKNCIIFLWLFIITVIAFAFSGGGVWGAPAIQTNTAQYLRLHIRAHTNGKDDQAVKYLVRDAIVDYLTPFSAEYENAEQAKNGLQARLQDLSAIANTVLKVNGFSYGARARITVEEFPTRVYGEFVLPQGTYWALVIELGSARGDNWWCVAYPPLCFTGTQNVVYKSKIIELIRRWKNE
jgi:stage II sporulation protein R